jgi:hypothetical protein
MRRVLGHFCPLGRHLERSLAPVLKTFVFATESPEYDGQSICIHYSLIASARKFPFLQVAQPKRAGLLIGDLPTTKGAMSWACISIDRVKLGVRF